MSAAVCYLSSAGPVGAGAPLSVASSSAAAAAAARHRAARHDGLLHSHVGSPPWAVDWANAYAAADGNFALSVSAARRCARATAIGFGICVRGVREVHQPLSWCIFIEKRRCVRCSSSSRHGHTHTHTAHADIWRARARTAPGSSPLWAESGLSVSRYIPRPIRRHYPKI